MMTNLRTMLLLAGVLLIVSNPCALAHTDVTVEQARELIDATPDLTVVDVREPYEYCDVNGHIHGALNYPWISGVLKIRYEELPTDGPILVVCRSGGRSNAAASFLDSKGFSTIYDMLGGMSAWQWETTPCKYSGGSGTADYPYQIATAADLIALGETPEDYDKHFILTADIDLDPNLPGRKVFGMAVIAPDIDPTWSKVESNPYDGRAFTGFFDGNGYVIGNLHIQGTGYLGLFGQLSSGAKISNLGLEGVNVNGTGNYIGGLVGANSGSITSSYSTGMVTGYSWIGGLVGSNWYGSISASYSSAMVSGYSNVGGLVGHTFYGSISASYSTGTVTGDGLVGGLVGSNAYGSIAVSYSTGTVSGEATVGGLVGTNRDGEIIMSYSTGMVIGGSNHSVGGLVGRIGFVSSITDCFWDMETSGQPESAGGEGKTTAEMQMESTFTDAGWDFVDEILNGTCDYWHISPGDYPRLCYQDGDSPGMPEGLGTTQQPYLIRDARDLGTVWFKPLAHYRLESSVDLSGTTWSMAVVPWFEGTFDGNDHTISHLTIKGGSYLGLFSQLGFGAKISNLGLKVVNVNGTGNYVGSLVGENNGSITSTYSTGTISGSWYVGGLVGCNSYGDIAASYSTGTVIGGRIIGGLVGKNLSSITSSFSSGTVTGLGSAGGLVGSNSDGLVRSDLGAEHGDGSVTTSYSNCKVKAYYSLGGLVGVNFSSITSSYSTGTAKGYSPDSLVGGLVGNNGGQHGNGSITTSFWDIETSGLSNMCVSLYDEAKSCDDSYGKTTTEMQRAGTFLVAGWDFVDETENGTEDIWWILEDRDYPRLWWQYGRAFSPHPQDGSIDVTQPLLLNWFPGGPDLHHDIYFGEDEETVANATIESPDIYRGRQPIEMTTYDPGTLEFAKTYYWRVDEVDGADPNSPRKSNVWSFTTADFIVVDDFENYNDLDPADPESNRIYITWVDGFDNPTINGSIVGYENPPFTEQTIVHSGDQSMSVFYDNTSPVNYSEATKTLTYPRDWTEESVGVLSLWFHGDPNNTAESMYVALSNANGFTAIVHHDDRHATQMNTWTEWRIELHEFAAQGVTLNNVDSISIGFGDKNNLGITGPSVGVMYFDDIRLYRPT